MILQNPVAHCFSDPGTIKRRFCNVCRKRLEDQLAVKCESKLKNFLSGDVLTRSCDKTQDSRIINASHIAFMAGLCYSYHDHDFGGTRSKCNLLKLC